MLQVFFSSTMNAVVRSNRGKTKRTHTSLRCETCNCENYHPMRNKRTMPTMEATKYCSTCRKRTLHKGKDTKH